MANAKNYLLEGSNDASFATKTTLTTKTNMGAVDHRIDSLTGLTGTYRYYRMYGTARNTAYGYSIYEARFYTSGTSVTYTITASCGPNGTISPTGNVSVNQGANQTFIIAPNSNYVVDVVTVDGVNVGACTSYGFQNVLGNRTINATFKLAPVNYTLTTGVNPVAGGTVSGAGSYTSGTTVTVTATSAAGYVFSSWSGAATGTANPTTVIMNASKSVTANFTLVPTYTVTTSVSGNGTISPSGTVFTNVGTARTFTMTPTAGYTSGGFSVDGVFQGYVSSYTFPAATTGTHTIYVVFQKINQLPVANAGADQSVATSSLVTLDGSASNDPDKYPYANLGYNWTQTGGPTVTLSNNGTAKPTFTPTATGIYTFVLDVFDGEAHASDNVIITVTSGGISIPGRIQAEDYRTGGEGVGYHDLTVGNTGGAYRTDNVDIETTSDPLGGGYNVGWADAGEWLEYQVNVGVATTCRMSARIASGVTGTKTLTFTLDGNPMTTITTSLNNGWQSFSDVMSNSYFTLPAGSHVIRVTTTGGLNMNYFDVLLENNPNLLTNGDFSTGLNGWTPLIMGSASATITNDLNSARFVVSAQGANAYEIQLDQNVALTANKTYTLEFDMKAAATPKNFKVVLEHEGDPWTKYHEQQYSVTAAANTWQHFSITFTPNVSDPTVRLGFHFGTFNTSTVWLDNVTLR